MPDVPYNGNIWKTLDTHIKYYCVEGYDHKGTQFHAFGIWTFRMADIRTS